MVDKEKPLLTRLLSVGEPTPLALRPDTTVTSASWLTKKSHSLHATPCLGETKPLALRPDNLERVDAVAHPAPPPPSAAAASASMPDAARLRQNAAAMRAADPDQMRAQARAMRQMAPAHEK